MKYNLKKEIVTFSGEFVKDQDGIQNALVSKIVINSLLAMFKDEADCSGEDKLKRYAISESINSNPESVELSNSDCVFIMKYVDKMGFAPLVYKHVHEVLEKKE